MKKRLVINADDYGMSRGTVDGIIQCVQAGVVTSTTIMATGAAFDYGIERLSSLGKASIGVHLDATSGTPVSPRAEIASLIDAAGRFVPRRDAAAVASMNPAELETEFRAQIRRVLDAGVKVSHLDNHHNWIYFSANHFRIVAKLAREFSLPLRFPFGSLSDDRVAVISQLVGLPEASTRSAIESCRSIMKELAVRHTDYFWIEFTSIHRTFEYLQSLLRDIPEGTSEICVHPGLETDRQKQELGILLQAAAEGALRKISGLELVTYSEAMR